MSFDPEFACDGCCVDSDRAPPFLFKTGAVNLAMMSAAQRNREFIADLEAETAWLREAQMMGIAGLPTTDQAGLFGNKSQMGPIADATRLRNSELTLVDPN